MALEEKRKIKELQDGIVADFHSKVTKIVGVDIPLDVDWDSFQNVQQLNGFPIATSSVSLSLEALCRDNMTKEEVKNGLKKITMKNTSGDKKVELKGGTLAMELRFTDGTRCTSVGEVDTVLKQGL